GGRAYCFDEAASYSATGPVPFAPAGVEERSSFSPERPAPVVRDTDWAQSGLPVIEWVMMFEGWQRRRANVSRGIRVNDVLYGRRETYYERRDQAETPMRLQNGARVTARPGADARSATIEVIEPERPYAPTELEVWTRLAVSLLGRPADTPAN